MGYVRKRENDGVLKMRVAGASRLRTWRELYSLASNEDAGVSRFRAAASRGRVGQLVRDARSCNDYEILQQ